MENEAFSFNEEDYVNSVEEIIDNLEGDEKYVYIGKTIKQNHKNFLDVDYLLEQMSDQAYDIGSEWTEDYLEGIDKNHKDNIEKMILEYMDKHIAQPNFYLIGEVEKVTVEEFRKRYWD